MPSTQSTYRVASSCSVSGWHIDRCTSRKFPFKSIVHWTERATAVAMPSCVARRARTGRARWRTSAARRGTRFEAIECLREAIHFTKGRYEDTIADLALLPGRAQDPRHRVKSVLRPPAGGKRMRRAIHPDPEGAAALAAPIPERRGAQLGAPRLRPPLQRTLDHRADRLPNARSAPTLPPRGGRVNTNFNLSQKLGAVHSQVAAARAARERH